jgi:hypothetical protein
MLKVRINDAQQIGIAVRPSMRDGAGQSPLAGPHQKTHPGL